jgi:phytoene desaturase
VRVVVVGAGLGGLSAAAHLVGRGHDVTIVERSATAGGRVGSFVEGGFRIDTGPTLLTMPGLLEEVFAAAGREMSSYLQLTRVDPMYRAAFSDGSVLHVHHDREAMADALGEFANAQAARGYFEFCDWLDRLFALSMPNLIDTNFDGVGGAARRWRCLLELTRLGAFRRLERKLAACFDDERLRQMFGFHALAIGLTPHEARGASAVGAYMMFHDGVYAPRGGMQAVPAALAAAVADAGASIRYSSPVTRLLRGGGGTVSGVEIGGTERLVADAVVCNVDLPVAYRTLVGGLDGPRPARRGWFAPSSLLWAAGVKGGPPAEAVHRNVHFGDPSSNAVRAVIRRGVRMSDPTTIVSVPSLTDPSLAPEGTTALQVVEPVPNLDGKVDWSRDGARLINDLRRRVSLLGYPSDVLVEHSVDPLDWDASGLERGTPWGLSHIVRQSGPLRPSNFDERVPGLAFAGASTVPGTGVPFVLLSGKLAAQRVAQYTENTRVVRW